MMASTLSGSLMGLHTPSFEFHKGMVLQRSKLFNAKPVDAAQCKALLTRIIWLVDHADDPLTRAEATELFFNVTKLFRVKGNHALRRLLYAAIKAVHAIAEDTIIVMAILIQDVSSTSQPLTLRGNALRLMARLTDASTLAHVERFIKHGLVSKDPYLTRSAAASCLYLAQVDPLAVSRWWTELWSLKQQPIDKIAQVFAIAALARLKPADIIFAARLLGSFRPEAFTSVNQEPSNVYAMCYVLRLCAEALKLGPASESPAVQEARASIVALLVAATRSHEDAILLEASRQILNSWSHFDATTRTRVLATLRKMIKSSSQLVSAAVGRALLVVSAVDPGLIDEPTLQDLTQGVRSGTSLMAVISAFTILRSGSPEIITRVISDLGSRFLDFSMLQRADLAANLKEAVAAHPKHAVDALRLLAAMLRDHPTPPWDQNILWAMHDMSTASKEAGRIFATLLLDALDSFQESLIASILTILAADHADNPAFLRQLVISSILGSASTRATVVFAIARLNAALESEASDLIHNLIGIERDHEVKLRAFYVSAGRGEQTAGDGRASAEGNHDLVHALPTISEAWGGGAAESTSAPLSYEPTAQTMSLNSAALPNKDAPTTDYAPLFSQLETYFAALDSDHVEAFQFVAATSRDASGGAPMVAAPRKPLPSSSDANLPIFKTIGPVPLVEPGLEHFVTLRTVIYGDAVHMDLLFNVETSPGSSQTYRGLYVQVEAVGDTRESFIIEDDGIARALEAQRAPPDAPSHQHQLRTAFQRSGPASWGSSAASAAATATCVRIKRIGELPRQLIFAATLHYRTLPADTTEDDEDVGIAGTLDIDSIQISALEVVFAPYHDDGFNDHDTRALLWKTALEGGSCAIDTFRLAPESFQTIADATNLMRRSFKNVFSLYPPEAPGDAATRHSVQLEALDRDGNSFLALVRLKRDAEGIAMQIQQRTADAAHIRIMQDWLATMS